MGPLDQGRKDKTGEHSPMMPLVLAGAWGPLLPLLLFPVLPEWESDVPTPLDARGKGRPGPIVQARKPPPQ